MAAINRLAIDQQIATAMGANVIKRNAEGGHGADGRKTPTALVVKIDHQSSTNTLSLLLLLSPAMARGT